MTFGNTGVYAIPRTPVRWRCSTARICSRSTASVPKTWAQFAAVAEAVHKQDPTVQITHFPQRDTGWFAGLASQNGARWAQIDGDKWLVNIDDAPTEEVAKYWQNLIDRGLVANMQGFSQQWNKALADGKLLTGQRGLGNATLASNVPTTSGKGVGADADLEGRRAHGSQLGGSSTAVLRGSDHPYEAAHGCPLAEHRPRFAEIAQPERRAIPSDQGGLDLPFLKQPSQFYGGQHIFDVFAQAADNADPDFIWSPTMTQTYASLADGFGAALGGDSTLSEALVGAREDTITAMRLGTGGGAQMSLDTTESGSNHASGPSGRPARSENPSRRAERRAIVWALLSVRNPLPAVLHRADLLRVRAPSS